MAQISGENAKTAEIDLDYARPLNVHTWSEYPEVNSFVNLIYEKHFVGSNYKSIRKHHLKKLLIDLYVAWLDDPELLLAMDRTVSKYNAKSRYNSLHISRTIIEVADHLSDVGLIDWTIGFKDGRPGGRSKNTKLWATLVLIEEFEKASESISRFDISPIYRSYNDSTRFRGYETVVLRNTQVDEYGRKKEVEVEYKDTKNTQEMRETLTQYNVLLHFHHIDLCNTDLNYVEFPQGGSTGLNHTTGKVKERNRRNTKMKRIFISQDTITRRVFNHNKWTDGGRFYGGWWQQIPSAYRKFIRIDGKPTVEVDYSAHHPVLLYAKKGINYWKEFGDDNDPYDLEEELKKVSRKNYNFRGLLRPDAGRYDHGTNEYGDDGKDRDLLKVRKHWEREFVKTLMLVAINAKTEKAIIGGTRRKIHEDNGDQFNERYNSLTDQLLLHYLKALKLKHKPISNYIGSNIGTKLQHQDSKITEQLILYFLLYDIPLLLVHDSYIVWKDHLQDLRFQMNKQWIRFSGLPESEATELVEGRFKNQVMVDKYPYFQPMKVRIPLGRKKQYVSERHRNELREFRKWKLRPDNQEAMKAFKMWGAVSDDTLSQAMKEAQERR